MAIKNVIRKIIKKVWGVDGISLFIKKQKKNINKRIYTKKYAADELVAVMCKMGMQKGSIVFIHSSMTEFYNYTGTAEELIQKMIDVIGQEGTLLMPAYPKNLNSLLKETNLENVSFDVNNTPSGAGYLSEVFRKWPGVKRSINIQHSVCAYGKLADYFTNEHHLSKTAWDERSPYYKICQTNTLVYSLGLPKFIGTIVHCTESLLKDKYIYFSLFFKKEVKYKYINHDGEIRQHTILLSNIMRKDRKGKIAKQYFTKGEYMVANVSNLKIKRVNAKYTLNRFLELAEQGITMYTVPSPKPYMKNGKFIELKK